MQTSRAIVVVLLLAMLSAGAAFGQYQDTSSDSARGYSNSRVGANISDQGSGYGPSPYGQYGPYYSRRAPVNPPTGQTGREQGQTDGWPNFGFAAPGYPSAGGPFNWARPRRSLEELGASWTETDDGLVANEIREGGELERIGLKSSDKLVSVDGHPIRTQAELQQALHALPFGRAVPIVVQRDGMSETLRYVYPEAVPAAEPRVPAGERAGAFKFITAVRIRRGADGRPLLGVDFDPQATDRAVVRTVRPNSAAQEAGLREGDVIVSFSGRKLDGPDELVRLVRKSQPGTTCEMYVSRGSAAPADKPADEPIEELEVPSKQQVK